MVVPEMDPLSKLSLPPGFRFYPTDEELLVQYLCRKVAGYHFSLPIIGDIDLYKFDPWVLPGKAMFGEKEWYFFSPRDRKYPNGSRPNRVAGSGYWKATGTDKIIIKDGVKVGIKKALVFYIGKAPKGTKTNWIMHEYRLFEPQRNTKSAKLDEWVLCRIYKKNSSAEKSAMGALVTNEYSHGSSESSSSQFDDVMESLPETNDRPFTLPGMNTLQENKKQGSLNLGSGNFDWATLAALGTLPELTPAVQAQPQSQPQLTNNGGENDVYASSMRHVESNFGMKVEEEVESGPIYQRFENSGLNFYQQHNQNGYSQGFSNSLDPFGICYPMQQGNLGFRQ